MLFSAKSDLVLRSTRLCRFRFELNKVEYREFHEALFEFLTHQPPTLGYCPIVALTGNGELGFDSGEGA